MNLSVTDADGFERLLSQPLNPLVYYQTLPGDVEFQDSAEYELCLDSLCANEDFNQLLTLLYLKKGMLDEAELGKLSLWASRKYSALLACGKMAREQRMKLQLINYAAQDLLAGKGCDVSLRSEGNKVSCLPPWDWLRLSDNTEYMIVSGEMGLHISAGSDTKRYDAGLATQLDKIDDHTVSVGSIFSSGGYIMRSETLTKIEHPEPIVLFFNGSQGLMFVDYRGYICSAADGRKIHKISCTHADKVRLIENKLYVSDWAVFGKMFVYDLSLGTQCQIDLHETYLMNDICAGNCCFYVVCKQQGCVFKYSLDFELLERKLNFGKQETELFDPISIRYVKGRLQVLSWVTGNLTSINAF